MSKPVTILGSADPAFTDGVKRGIAAMCRDQIKNFDAIFIGAVGAPDVPDHVALWVATFGTASQMLDHLGEADAATRLMSAVEKVCADGILTPDLGGTVTTQEVTDAVCDAIRGDNI